MIGRAAGGGYCFYCQRKQKKRAEKTHGGIVRGGFAQIAMYIRTGSGVQWLVVSSVYARTQRKGKNHCEKWAF